MKKYGWLLGSLLALGLGLTPALAQAPGGAGDPGKKDRPGKKERKAKGGLRGYYAQIASICKLTPEQVEKFAEALKPYMEAQKANRDKLTELRKAQTEARKAKDKDKAAQIAKQIKEIQDAIDALRAKAMDVLTDDQKIVWEGHLLYRSAMQRFKKTGVDEAQQKKIREMCDAKGKAIFEAKDEKAKRAIRNALAKEVFDTVLTPEQQAKAKAAKPKTPREKRPKKGKPAPEATEK